MTSFLQLALALAVIITAAKAGGYLSYRLGQPSVLGELLVGVLLGPSAINLLHLSLFSDTHLPEVVHNLAEIGVLLLMFVAGLDLHLEDLIKSGKVAALSGVLGVVMPLALGAGVALLFGAEMLPSIFIGLILSATSVSISAQTLMELKVLRTRVGIGMLGAAVFDDILVVLGVSVFLALTDPAAGGGLGGALWSAGRMVIYLVLALAAGSLLLPRFARRVTRLPITQGLIAFTFVTILVYAWTAEFIGGMAAITGAFVAGLMLARTPLRERIENGIAPIAYGVFVPVFFVNVGLSANIRELTGSSLLLLAALTVAAVVGKVAGAGFGALLSGFSRLEALQLGVGMMSRGEVGLIVASVGVAQGAIDEGIFAVVVGLVIITTLMTPPLLRALFLRAAPAAAAGHDEAPKPGGAAHQAQIPDVEGQDEALKAVDTGSQVHTPDAVQRQDEAEEPAGTAQQVQAPDAGE